MQTAMEKITKKGEGSHKLFHLLSCWADFAQALTSFILVFSRGARFGLWAARGAIVTKRTEVVYGKEKCVENVAAVCYFNGHPVQL